MTPRLLPFFLMVVGVPALGAQQPAGAWDAVARALGKPVPATGETYRATFPRSDLHVRVGSVIVEPALALTSWTGFAGPPDSCDVMGDLVLGEREVPLVVPALLDRGIDVTAVHHHLLAETPRVFYVHFHGRGAAADLAAKLQAVLALTATPLGTAPAPVATPAASTRASLDTAALFAALGVHGRLAGDVAQVSVPTSGSQASLDGRPIPAALGMNTAINVEPFAPGRAAAAGDFVLTSDRLRGVLRALTTAAIRVTAVHNHMVGEEPRVFFVHFWGEGDPVALARELKSALDAAR